MHPVDLLEREGELAELDALVLDAKAGEARLALIEGPAGIGKTQLVAELRRRAEAAGLRVLTARGSELEREFPFGVVRQLFEPVLDEAAFSGAAAAARPVFAAPGDEPDTGAASFSTLHGLYWLALNLAEGQPLLVAVDDLHWVDPASLRFLAYVLRRVEGVPILFAAGLRSAEPGTDPGLLAEIVHDPATVQVHPGPLSMGGIGAMVLDILGEEPESDFCDACYQATGGNPLLLRQLLTALAAEKVRPEAAQARVVREIGPRAVSRTVILRLARLSAEAQQVARTVAILGEGAALHAAAALAELDEPTAARATGELATAEILRHGSPLGFVHPLVRDAVYRELPPGERELQHAHAARMLRDMGAPIEQVAAHLLMTSPRGEEWVADALQEAGRAAIRKGASDSAPAYLRRALREPPPGAKRPQLLLELGIAEILTDGASALEHLRMAYDTLADPLGKGIAAAVLGRVVLFTGDPPGAGRLALKAAGELPPELADLRRALEAFEACTHFFGDPDWSNMPDLSRYRALPAADAPVGEKMLAAVAAVYWAYSGGNADECSELALAALRGGDVMRADNGLVGIAAIRPLVIADREEAVQAWELALTEAHGRGSIFELAGIHLWYGFTQYWRGELSDAEATLRTAMEELGRWGFGANADWYCSAFLGATLIARGDVAGARSALARAENPGERTSDGARTWHHTEVAVLLAEGRYDEAIAGTERCERLYGGSPNPADSPWRTFRAFALHRLGRDKEAEAVAREELELARAWGSPGTVGRVLRTLGRTRGEAGMKDIQDAIDVLEGTPARLEHARAVAALGTAVRRFGRPTDAREPLRRALELASQCDATLLVEEVRAELQTVGVRPRSDAATGVESLTPSERRVVDLAVGGGTNRDIAQELYVTPKTVEVHLSNAYRKLGVRGRRELPQVLTA
jgi:DNA-binding CsgD family transcriptional regulator/Flp pilus assembly protein TadD